MSSAGTLSLPSCFTLVCVCLYMKAACCLKVCSPGVHVCTSKCACVWPENLVWIFPSPCRGSAPTYCPFPFFINQTSHHRPFPLPARIGMHCKSAHGRTSNVVNVFRWAGFMYSLWRSPDSGHQDSWYLGICDTRALFKIIHCIPRSICDWQTSAQDT